MGGSSAPKPDKAIGEAALLSAQTGQDYLAWMKEQADTTNQWAAEDRQRYTDTFLPLQDQYIEDAQNYVTDERIESRQNAAGADIQQAASQARDANLRSSMAMGVDPRSGRFREAAAKAATDTALASAGAKNLAKTAVEQEGEAKMANAINMGSGLAVNPATSAGLSTGAISSGFSGAMQGYGQQGSLLNQQYANQLQQWQASQSAMGGLGSALGAIGGALIMSSEDYKEDKTPFDALGAIKKMPVEKWRYKEGIADEAEHVGPYAEDFKEATGIGDGKSIDVISAIGVSLGAIRQIADKVDNIEQRMVA
ncbi:tail fiber domain-containing protein [Celeribacter sp.]|uniref:tail fiber domain-containing protein n=1 Tax=Celeribacter sp. TaxID=1890673 RepID=UPI003A8F0CAE